MRKFAQRKTDKDTELGHFTKKFGILTPMFQNFAPTGVRLSISWKVLSNRAYRESYKDYYMPFEDKRLLSCSFGTKTILVKVENEFLLH